MKYSIGLDFGTLSVRGVLVSVDNGDIVNSSVSNYSNGVIDSKLNNKVILPNDFALQNAKDYIDSMESVIKYLVKTKNVRVEDIIGIGIDFTSSTILPIKKDGTLLSELDEFKDNPHAYVKLWKHHAAERYAIKISDLANELNENWIKRYGNKISSEWMLPKVYEILDKAPEVFNEADYFIEAGDYITFYLTGELKRSSCQAGYKNTWHFVDGYPSSNFLKKLDERLTNIYKTKLSGDILPIGSSQGKVIKSTSKKLGINQIDVGVSVIDAHVATPACKVMNNGDMLMIIGTSSCDIVLSDKDINIPGIQGVVRDGAIPGLFAYESGQPAVGDIFSWYIEKHVSKDYYEEAKSNNQNIYQFMENKVRNIPKSSQRLLALDWWNGNRSVLVDPDLTGLIIGYNLKTKQEDIYRALIEATAFGKRKTIETYENAGIEIKRVIACGGLATKNKYLLECYASVFNKPIYFSEEEYAPALGAAIFGALAANSSNELVSVNKIVDIMGNLNQNPILPSNEFDYDELYDMYNQMHNYFGIENDIMKRLKKV